MIKLKRIVANNFKSFGHLDIDFSDFTLIVGANASGKSNFVCVLKFIKDIILFGIDDAISLQGGIRYLRNFQADIEECISIDFALEVNEPWNRLIRVGGKGNAEANRGCIREIKYSFKIKPAKRGNGYKIVSDVLEIQYAFVSTDSNNNEEDQDGIVLKFYKQNSRCKYTYTCEFLIESSENTAKTKAVARALGADFFCEYMRDLHKELMLSKIFLFMPPFFNEESFINIFDFDPKKIKHSCSIAAFKHLKEDGSNLALIIHDILRSKESRHRFNNLLNDILPAITNVSVQQNIDQSVSYKITEKYCNCDIYSNFLSDGTASIIAFIVALYFEPQAKILIFEEPERNIHPKLLSSLMAMTDDVSQKKQIIFTTHNSEMLRNADIENIRLIQRDKTGFSIVSKPGESKTVINFLNNELSIDELFINDLLR